jgi:CrcB protein
MIPFVLVGLGGALGAVGRYGLARWAMARGAPNWPWGTFAANAIGSFVLGVALVLANGEPLLFIGVGFCGGLTTFSSFAADMLMLVQAGRRSAATYYAIGSIVTGLLCVIAGLVFGGLFS